MNKPEIKYNNAPIGIMDSGVGGLTVLKEITNILPTENLIYVADSEYFPYGEKTREEIAQRAIIICEWLVKKGCKAVVIACNTATVSGLEAVRTYFQARNYEVPVMGVIHAGSIEAAKATHNGRIGVLATPVTVESKAYTFGIKAAADTAVYVEEVGCPALTNFVENELANMEEKIQFSPTQVSMAKSYLLPLQNAGVDTIVLGCTHYPLAVELLKQAFDGEVKFVSPSKSTAEELKLALHTLGIQNSRTDKGNVEAFYTGDQSDTKEQKFAKMYNLVFGATPKTIKPCSLHNQFE